MDFETLNTIANIFMWSNLIPFFLGLIRFRLNSNELKLLPILTGASFVSDMTVTIIYLWGVSSRKYINHPGSVNAILEVFVLLTIYYIAFGQRHLRKFFLITGLVYFLFSTLNILFLQQDKINSYSDTLSAIVFIILPIAYFYKLMVDLSSTQIHRLPMFWINSAVFIYYAGIFLFTR